MIRSWQSAPVLAAIEALERPRPTPTVAAMTRDIAAGIRVLVTRDGVALSEEQVMERTNNIVTGLLGNFTIEALED